MMRWTIAALLLFLFAAPALAVPGDGVTAYRNRNYETAYKEFQPLAMQGNSEAQYYLGEMYRLGLGVPQHDNAAAQWYLCAAEQGIGAAQFHLGDMYRNGRGVAQDHGTAVEWYRRAAAQDLAAA